MILMIYGEDNAKTYRIRSQQDLTMAVVDVQRTALLNGSSLIDRSKIATMLSELGSNILKYARLGTLKIKRIEEGSYVDIELIAEDRGPGIPCIDLALQDHYSTGGTLGLGLPGVKRMSDEFRVRSSPGEGTVVVCRKRIVAQSSKSMFLNAGLSTNPEEQHDLSDTGSKAPTYDWGCFVRPCTGNAVTGDSLILLPKPDDLLLAVIDGSGHGQSAATIAQSVETLVRQSNTLNLSALMFSIHDRLCGTQGAAVGLMSVERMTGHYRYVGVGNTRVAKLGKRPWRGFSRDGVLGSRTPRLTIQEDRLEPGDLVMLWTDGLPDQESRNYVGTIAYRSAAGIARQWVMHLGRFHDDVGCGVLKWQV